MTQSSQTRICQHCSDPIPKHKIASAKYCHGNCARKATYHRKSPADRAEINKRSNDRRFKQDLLPLIRTASRLPEGITPGSDVARWAVACFLIARKSSWKLDLALNFNQCRNNLATLAGGECQLEELEEMIFEKAVEIQEQQEAKT